MMKKLLTGLAVACSFLAACNSKTTMTGGSDSTAVKAEKNRITTLKAENAFLNKQVDSMFVSCAKDFTDYGDGSMKAMTNADTIKAGLKAFMTAFPDMKAENMTAFAHGDSVVVTATWTGTFKKDMMGMKATGKSFKYSDADIFVYNSAGKMISHRSTQAPCTFFGQLGITMPPPPPPAAPKEKK